MSTLRESPAWKALETHHKSVQKLHLRDMFAKDETRAERFTAEAAPGTGDRSGLLVEYDKTDSIFTSPSDKRTEDYVTGRFG